jgi:hypothetical protein
MSWAINCHAYGLEANGREPTWLKKPDAGRGP